MVDRDFREAFLQACVVRSWPAGHSLTLAGDEHGCASGVVAGQADFTSGITSDDAPITDIALPGDWWGFHPLRGVPRAMHAVARTPLTLAQVSLGRVATMLRENPAWWQHISLFNSLKMERWGVGMVDMAMADSRRRCIAVLLRLTNSRFKGSETRPVTICFTQEQLAKAANLSRYPTGQILRDLKRLGLIDYRYGTITVTDAAALRGLLIEDQVTG